MARRPGSPVVSPLDALMHEMTGIEAAAPAGVKEPQASSNHPKDDERNGRQFYRLYFLNGAGRIDGLEDRQYATDQDAATCRAPCRRPHQGGGLAARQAHLRFHEGLRAEPSSLCRRRFTQASGSGGSV
jgi:hypothetical protein